jgi:hypothetical protein
MRPYPQALAPLPLLLASLLTACSSPGAIFPVTAGQAFKPRSLSDDKHVLVYLYRPQSQWADDELEAPCRAMVIR